MTAFVKANFDMGRGRERYVIYEGRFIGRFKYANASKSAAHFVKFLIANFTVEEFFAGLEQPLMIDGRKLRNLTPFEVLETKGFIDYNMLQAMKREGCATKRELLDLLATRALASIGVGHAVA